MTAMDSTLRKLMPASLKRIWWYCTDSQWRETYRSVAQRQRTLRDLQGQAFRLLWIQTHGHVTAGPFQDLTYLGDKQGSYAQKLLGTYEKELWPIVEEIITRSYELIIDIGAAEGYYVCGLARRLPTARIVAFEAQRACHRRIQELARLNGLLERIECRGLCRADDLRTALVGIRRTLIVCDVEGAEFELLDPAAIPGLRDVDILVEVHDHLRPGVGNELHYRFQATHEIQSIPSARRTIDDLPSGVSLPECLAFAAMEESRGGQMAWLWMSGRSMTLELNRV